MTTRDLCTKALNEISRYSVNEQCLTMTFCVKRQY